MRTRTPLSACWPLIREELGRPTQRRLSEIEPDRWWLADPDDLENAATPLADRVEWGVFSLLSTAGPMAETAFFERIASMFGGPDLPDEGLVRACLDSYRSLRQHARAGHHRRRPAASQPGAHGPVGARWPRAATGSACASGSVVASRPGASAMACSATCSKPVSSTPTWAGISSRRDDLAEVDAIWYLRGKVAFLFEVEWTAMLNEPLLRRHARIPPDDSFVRFLVIAPERTELVRHKLARRRCSGRHSKQLNWHVIKSVHLRTCLDRDPLDLADLEPYLGLDPAIERSAEQMPLFGA